MINDNTAKIINLKDYLKGHLPLKANVIQSLLDEVRTAQDATREDASTTLLKDRKLKDVENLRDRLVEFDILLLRVSSFLDKKVAATDSKEEKEKQEALLKQCSSLQSINEKTKKLVTDDIANHKSHAVNAITAAGTMLVTPFSVEKIVETFISKQPNVTSAAYDAGAILGIYLAFHHQINNAGKKAAQVIVKMPGRIKTVHRRARNAAFVLTMSVSVSIKQAGDIEARQPDRLAARPKSYFTAKV